MVIIRSVLQSNPAIPVRRTRQAVSSVPNSTTVQGEQQLQAIMMMGMILFIADVIATSKFGRAGGIYSKPLSSQTFEIKCSWSLVEVGAGTHSDAKLGSFYMSQFFVWFFLQNVCKTWLHFCCKAACKRTVSRMPENIRNQAPQAARDGANVTPEVLDGIKRALEVIDADADTVIAK